MDQVQLAQNIGVDRATIRTGDLGEIYGMPVVISEFLSADLQSTGKFTTTGGATTSALLVNKDRFKLGVRRGNLIESQKDITRGVTNNVITIRETLINVDPSDKKNCHLAFNILSS